MTDSISKRCVECGTEVPTISNTPLCSKSCQRDYADRMINSMSDEDAWCPTCGTNFESVSSVCYHHNKKHSFKVHRTSDCANCGDNFKPSNYDNPNKYCSRECFADDKRIGDGGNYYSGNWQSQRELAIERDFSRCRCCRMSREEHKEKFGCDISVHHRTPLLQFDSTDKANELHNLITLCKDCHTEVESEITKAN